VIVFKNVKKTQQTSIEECFVIHFTSAVTSTMIEMQWIILAAGTHWI